MEGIRTGKVPRRAGLIVGGGLNTGEKIYTALAAGADLVVVGNHIERDPNFLAEAVSQLKRS